MLRIIVPRLHYGTVYYLPAKEVDQSHSQNLSNQNQECDDEEVDLPCLDSPVPSTWQQLEGPFHNVYAMKQVSLLNFFVSPNSQFAALA